MTLEYIQIGFFLGIAFFISSILVGIPYFLSLKEGYLEKVSPYECGFQPFEDARQEFDVRFYVVALLFLIFDLEIVYMVPWGLSLVSLGFEGYWSMVCFLGILTLGFVYEWLSGALNW